MNDGSVLVLDDEKNVLKALERSIGKKYDLRTTTDPEEALSFLKMDDGIEVIISDQRMESTTGVEFLEKCKKIAPNTKRIILSGYCDFITISHAIDEGTVHKFVQKPWDDSILLETIDELLDSNQKNFSLSNVDFLTGLGNKRGLLEELAYDKHKNSSLFLLDIHRFRNLNAAYGQITADAILEKIGNLLSEWAFNHDNAYVARTFADEFAIIVDNNLVGLTQKEVANQLRGLLSRHLTVNGIDFKLSIYIGSTAIAGQETTEVIKKSRFALMFAKKNGTNSYQTYEPDYMDAFIKQEVFIDQDIWKALENNELLLHFQPTFTENKELFGVQALLRWNHPKFGLVPPFRFLPIIENSGYMLAVGEWIIQNAIKAQVELSKAIGHDLKMIVKISPKQFEDSNFRNIFVGAVDKYSATPSNILCELTETTVANKSEECAYHMRQLNALGIGAVINGLGTGHSTLSLFQKTSFQYLKINQLLVQNIEHSPDVKKSVLSLIQLSSSMGAKVIGCGIESKEQLTLLKEMGCDLFEGFYLSEPVDENTLISQHNGKAKRWATES